MVSVENGSLSVPATTTFAVGAGFDVATGAGLTVNGNDISAVVGNKAYKATNNAAGGTDYVLKESTTLAAQFTVAGKDTLTIPEGVTVTMGNFKLGLGGKNIAINGKLIVANNASSNLEFTSTTEVSFGAKATLEAAGNSATITLNDGAKIKAESTTTMTANGHASPIFSMTKDGTFKTVSSSGTVIG